MIFFDGPKRCETGLCDAMGECIHCGADNGEKCRLDFGFVGRVHPDFNRVCRRSVPANPQLVDVGENQMTLDEQRIEAIKSRVEATADGFLKISPDDFVSLLNSHFAWKMTAKAFRVASETAKVSTTDKMVLFGAAAIAKEGLPKGQESASDYRKRLSRAALDAALSPLAL